MRKKMTIVESNSELLKEWDYVRNKEIDPNECYRSSIKEVWWICKKDNRHRWLMKINRRVYNNSGCLYCSGKQALKSESFAVLYPDLMEEWDSIKNSEIDPYSLSRTSNRKVDWICKKNKNHVWAATVYSRAHNGTGCKKCSFINKPKRGGKKLLKDSHPRIAKEWDFSKNSQYDLNIITHASSRRVGWICSLDPSHKWESTVTNRTSNNVGCPICNQKTPSKANSLKSIYPEVAKEWHYAKNAPVLPENITKASGKKVWWLCKIDPEHEWQAVVRNRTTLGSKCPKCDKEIKVMRLRGYMLEDSGSLTEHYRLFMKALFTIETLIKEANFSQENYSKSFLRLAFSSIFASLEAYLADYFYDQVMTSEIMMNKLFVNSEEFKKKKFNINEVLGFQANKKEKAKRYIQNIIWHRLNVVEGLYSKVLSISFDKELINSINESIFIRHDIVHRNGRDKNGYFREITEEKIIFCIGDVKKLVENIERKSV
ncbi:MAG: zinc-ribbon domain-containing protein [Colwellia sp.]